MPEDWSSMYTNPAFSLKLEKPENFSLLAQILLSYRKKPMGGSIWPPIRPNRVKTLNNSNFDELILTKLFKLISKFNRERLKNIFFTLDRKQYLFTVHNRKNIFLMK